MVMTKKYKKGVLCNQGCGTRVYFQVDEKGKKKPYNVLDKEKHKCPMLHMAKLWGGKYNTIPMGPIKGKIVEAYNVSSVANKRRNIDDILKALQITIDNLYFVTFTMESKEIENAAWSNELEAYKKKLVEDQRRREEQEEEEKKSKEKGHEWRTGDELI